MRQQGLGSTKEMLDINFMYTSDDNLEPRIMCSGIGQVLQEDWATLIVITFVECIDDKHKSMFWLAGSRSQCRL